MLPPMLFDKSSDSISDLINELDVDTYLNLQMEFLKYHTDFWNEPLPNCDHGIKIINHSFSIYYFNSN
jgi:hypothetical protein